MSDQADKLRQLVGEAQQGASDCQVPLVLVCGGQRGAGASTVALQLALAGHSQRRRSLVVDASFRESNYYVPQRSQRYDTIVDVVAGGRTVSEVLQSGPHGLQVAPAAPLPPALADISGKTWGRIVGQLRSLRSAADLILIDGGAGASAINMPLWAVAELVLIVAGPQAVGVMDAYAAVKTASSRVALPKVAIVINQSTDQEEAYAASARIAAAASRFLNIEADTLPPIPVIDELAGESGAPRRLLKDSAVRVAFGELAQRAWDIVAADGRSLTSARRAA